MVAMSGFSFMAPQAPIATVHPVRPHSGNTMAELVALIYGERKRHVKQQHLGDESLKLQTRRA